MPRIVYMLVFIVLTLPAFAQKPIRPKGDAGIPLPVLTGRWMADSSISMTNHGPRRDVNLNLIYTFKADSTMLIAKGNEPAQVIGKYRLTRENKKVYMTIYKGDKPITIKMELQGVTNNYMAIYSEYPTANSTQYFTRLDRK